MKKIIFNFNIDNVIDIITNSSSELFVLNGQTKTIVDKMIKYIYPNYENEYDDLKSINDLTVDELDTFFDFACSAHMWPAKKYMYPVLDGFTFEELYCEKDEETGGRGQQYELRNNVTNPSNSWDRSFVTEENIEFIKNKLDPNGTMFFLFSKDENPDWDMQEKLMELGQRYHLG